VGLQQALIELTRAGVVRDSQVVWQLCDGSNSQRFDYIDGELRWQGVRDALHNALGNFASR
jgi:hypothetical protein